MIEANLHRIPIDRGNIRRIDLIREFSMQVHHVRFSISAHRFFEINLDLFGSVG